MLTRGTRVRFGGFGSPDPSDLDIGTEGTVVDSGRNSIQGDWVYVRWDNGSALHMLLSEGDRVTPVGPAPDVGETPDGLIFTDGKGTE